MHSHVPPFIHTTIHANMDSPTNIYTHAHTCMHAWYIDIDTKIHHIVQSVCVCERETRDDRQETRDEREGERERDRQTDRQTEREREKK